ncbi:hypothetical protein [Thermoleptolyngbya sp. C42_A2020_037]|uniref:hypothetical protein n=1 Tax=Thermoleptolyngbya sp. C42_A2020_037 TaxID=2747799 RepID=UPI0019E44B76|nr:hypothetical protein [Thermoleptolyngbya sp. C42_A2020_037]MBF2084891.1 hypothetical protein [Thermoleptolyngbya sp. C42_A2020_037]
MAPVPSEPQPSVPELSPAGTLPNTPDSTRPNVEPVWVWSAIGLVLLLVPVGVGSVAVRELLMLPALPRCWSVAQSSNSSSTRIYCAEISANKQTVEDLRRAIQLANQVDADDPLRDKSDRLIEQWTQDILRLGEAEFQAGSLDRARDIAKRVPFHVATYATAEAKIKEWEAIWAKAEKIYSEVEAEIDQENWFAAMSAARMLLTVGNQYWATTQYQALMRLLQSSRESEATARRSPNSANKGGGLNDLIRQWETEQTKTDTERLKTAQELAQGGRVEDLRAAVDAAEQVLYGTPQYDQAQSLINTWRRQIEAIEDRPRLARADELARQGDVRSLEAAIDEVNQITWGRSLHEEARTQADTWRRQVHELRLREQEEMLRRLDRSTSTTPPPLPAPLPPVVPVVPSALPISEPVLTLPAEGTPPALPASVPTNVPASDSIALPGDRSTPNAMP